MAENVTLNVKIITRNDTAAQWGTQNPVLLKGELGYDSTAKMLKIGDGTNTWDALEYIGAKPAEEGTGAPDGGVTDKELGSIYVDTESKKAYILIDKTEDSSTWKQIITPEDISGLGVGDMLKAEFATNEKASQGYVDKAILADTATEATHATSADSAVNATNAGHALTAASATTAESADEATHATSADTATNADHATSADTATSATKLATGRTITVAGDVTGVSEAFDGTKGVTITTTLKNSGVEAGAYTKVTVDSKGIVTSGAQAVFTDITDGSGKNLVTALGEKQNTITGAATTIVGSNLTADRVLVSDGAGKVAVSNVDKATLEGMSSRIDTIAGQIDNIPKYNYLTGVEASTTDENIENQTEIDAVVKPIIVEAHESANKWDAVVANITFTPSDVEKDAVYYYNGADWVFLYYVSTGINRANGTTAGIVENSTDITFVDGQGTVNQAGKVKNALTAGGKTFDGSAPVTIEAADLGALTSVPAATSETIGGLKSSNAINGINVAGDGTATVNKIAVAKLDLNGDTLILDGGNA